MSTATLETKAMNHSFLDQVTSGDPQTVKEAAHAVDQYTRVKLREEGFYRSILPMETITDDDLDRQVDTDKPVRVEDKEPDSPAAMMVAFATLPEARYILGPRYRVMFARIMTPKFIKDIEELRTWNMDIRQILSDNAIKDMLAEEDSKWIKACNNSIGAASSTVPETGAIQHKSFSGAITRENLAESRKIMPSTSRRLHPKTALINHVSIKDVEKWERPEVGGDLAQDILLQGFSERVFNGMNWIITIKADLVPDSTIYYFAEPKYLGVSYALNEATMWVKNEAFLLQFFAYECIGGAIGNVAAIARANFDVTGASL